jgi:hypothetical protein
MALDPEKKSPQAKPEVAPDAVNKTPAPLANPSPARSSRSRSSGPRNPGEAYTPMPDFIEPKPSDWRYLVAAALLALTLTAGYLKLHPRAPAPAPAASQSFKSSSGELVPLPGVGAGK